MWLAMILLGAGIALLSKNNFADVPRPGQGTSGKTIPGISDIDEEVRAAQARPRSHAGRCISAVTSVFPIIDTAIVNIRRQEYYYGGP